MHQMWQTDFTYFRSIGWGWYDLSIVLDEFSRYIIAWKLGLTMGATDITETLDEAIAIAGVEQDKVENRRRLLSDLERGEYLIANCGHPSAHLKHPTHLCASIIAFLSIILIAPVGQKFGLILQPLHGSSITSATRVSWPAGREMLKSLLRTAP